MKKTSKLSYIILIVVIALACIVVYSTKSKGNNEKTSKQKVLAEIKYFGSNIEVLLNKLNNIDVRNYKVSVSEISKSSEGQQSKSASNQGKAESESDSEGGQNASSKQGSSGTASENEKSKKYEMVKDGVLLKSEEVDWQNIKSEIEILYTTISTLTLDLYQIDASQEDILGFNRDFDKLLLTIKDEKKEEALSDLAKIYEYIAKFTDKVADDELVKKVTETKVHIYNAYSKLEANNWEEIKNETKEAIRIYNGLLSSSSIEEKKQYSISKGFVMLNELQSAADNENQTAYLIKYKNLLEEINNI